MRIILPLGVLCIMLAGCMSIPPGVHVVTTDQPQSICLAYTNCYDPLTRTIVLVPGGSTVKTEAHELCHAHQQEEVISETGHDVSIDEHEWYATREAQAYAVAIAGEPRPADWVLSRDNELEDFAESCARYLVYGTIKDAPQREAFFTQRDFR